MTHGSKYGISKWYVPGDWALPKWWTDGPPTRGPHDRLTYQELEEYYSGWFVTHVLKHTGGLRDLPAMDGTTEEVDKDQRTVKD